jgi:hypothetical protein
LAGCSVLSGRTSTESRRPGGPPSDSSAAKKAATAGFTDERTVSAVLKDAQHDFETVYTYDYRNLGKYRSAGLQVTANPYTNTYRRALEGRGAQVLTAQKYSQVASANVAGLVGLSDHNTQATAIVNGSISAMSVKNPSGATKTVTLTLKLQRIGSSWRISDTQNGAAAQGSVPANGPLRKAISAARSALTHIYGLHRSSFNSDYQKALAFTTDTLHDTMTQKQSSVQQTLTTGKYDLSAKIVGFAVVKPNPNVRFIVTLDQFHVGRQGAQLGPFRTTLAVTVVYVDNGWLVSTLTPVS